MSRHEAARAPAGVGCGAAASGHYQWNNPEQIAQLLLCMVMSGPFLTGYTQTINDWYDKEIDAINEPYRPIPSGRIQPDQVIAQIWFLLIGGIAISAILDKCALCLKTLRCCAPDCLTSMRHLVPLRSG